MPGHIGIGPVDYWLVKASLGDPGLEIVADRLAGDAAEMSKGADMRRDPIRQLLAPHRLGPRVRLSAGPRTGSGETRRAQNGDKIWTGMISPVRPSTTSPARPAKSTNSFSPAMWVWRIDALSAGISFPCCSAKERAYLRLKAVDDAGRYTLTSP
jgi:hypothetical protein